MRRRELLLSSVGASLGMLGVGALNNLAAPFRSQNPSQEEDPLAEGGRGLRLLDEEAGDTDSEIERLNVNRDLLDKLLEDYQSKAIGVRKNSKNVAMKQLEVASSYVGVSREKKPGQVNQFLALFKYRLKYPSG